MLFRSGSVDNIKPEFVLAALYDRMGLPFKDEEFQIHREEVYTRMEDTGDFVSLLEIGQEIL